MVPAYAPFSFSPEKRFYLRYVKIYQKSKKKKKKKSKQEEVASLDVHVRTSGLHKISEGAGKETASARTTSLCHMKPVRCCLFRVLFVRYLPIS